MKRVLTTVCSNVREVQEALVLRDLKPISLAPCILELDFNHGVFGRTGDKLLDSSHARVLAEAIAAHKFLFKLVLKGNCIGNNGTFFFAKSLEINKSLKTLDLSNNSVSAQGFKALFSALKNNHTLTYLNVSGNSMDQNDVAKQDQKNQDDDFGSKFLADALCSNTTLKTLDISNNFISYEGAQAILNAVKVNTSLTQLVITGTFLLLNSSLTSPSRDHFYLLSFSSFFSIFLMAYFSFT